VKLEFSCIGNDIFGSVEETQSDQFQAEELKDEDMSQSLLGKVQIFLVFFGYLFFLISRFSAFMGTMGWNLTILLDKNISFNYQLSSRYS